MLKKQQKHIKTSGQLILILFVWCILLTGYTVISAYQQQQKELNKMICIQEYISLDAYEVIND